MLNWRNWTWKHLFVALLVLHLIPIWIFAYFPSQDGPSHVYNGLVLKEYAKPANYKLRDAWELNITVFPNWLSHIALMLLLYVFPPVIAEKVFLTIAIGMIPIAFFYFLHAVHGKPKEEEGEAGRSWHTFAWLGFPFAYNYLLYMGFYNFTLSIAFFFFSFGFWWKHKDDMQVQHLVWLYVLLLLTYLSHIASYGLVVLGMSIVAGCLWGGNALATTWRERNARWTHQLWQCLKPLIRFGLYMVPMYFVLLDYYLFSIKEHPTGNHRGMEWVWDYFVGIKSIVYFTDWHVPVNQGLLIVLGTALVIAIVYRIRREEWVKQTDAFLLIAILFTAMFIRAPWSYGPGGWINDRIHLYILLMLAPWFITNMDKVVRYAIAACLIVFSLIHFGITAYDHGRIAPEIEELVSGTHLIEPHTVFEIRTADWHRSEALGKIKYVTPFAHSTAFYGVYADDVVHLANYESAYYYFPVNRNTEREDLREGTLWRRATGSVDYVVSWHDPGAEAELAAKDYEVIHETKHLQLFRKKRVTEPTLEQWDVPRVGYRVIRFDMQPDGAETAPGYQAIVPNTAYVSGKFGWDTRAPHEAHHVGRSEYVVREHRPLTQEGDVRIETLVSLEQKKSLQDAVWSNEEAAFKIDLPNGTYRITNTFCASEDATHTVSLLANGKQVLKELTVSGDDNAIEHSYRIIVTEGYLTQVISTPQKRVRIEDDWETNNHYWVWNSCIVKRMTPSRIR